MSFERIRELIGCWRLVSTSAVGADGKPAPQPYGPKPQGFVEFGVDGRMFAVLCDGRPRLPAQSSQREFNSYAGNFTFDGEQLVTLVDASSNPHWVGGEQVRTARFEDGRLVLLNGRRTLVWERRGE